MRNIVGVAVLTGAFLNCLSAAPNVKSIKIDRGLTKEAQSCIECHADKSPGIVQDWIKSRHAHANVTCIDCHEQPKDSPMASQSCPGAKAIGIHMSVLVSPNTCKRCHPSEVQSFSEGGHLRAAMQIESKKGLSLLKYYHEGQAINEAFAKKHPELLSASDETGCIDCHGVRIKLDEEKRPTKDTWPNAGMGNIYPDGGVGTCIVCHTRHTFDIAEARKPDACASCHLGPDHPNIEIFENSKHGHIWKTSHAEYNFKAAPDAWEPGDYRAPTCAVCHMSGIGKLKTTHNVSRRLYWNLWGIQSKPRTAGLVAMKKVDPPVVNDAVPQKTVETEWVGEALTGHEDGPEAARNEMKQVCSNCHTPRHSEGFFASADKMVVLYNEAYFKPATKMLNDLKEKGLLDKNPWKDEFQVHYYHLWHHEGRRMRQGALMQAPDYAHWHGVFEVFHRLYELEKIYKERTEGKHE